MTNLNLMINGQRFTFEAVKRVNNNVIGHFKGPELSYNIGPEEFRTHIFYNRVFTIFKNEGVKFTHYYFQKGYRMGCCICPNDIEDQNKIFDIFGG